MKDYCYKDGDESGRHSGVKLDFFVQHAMYQLYKPAVDRRVYEEGRPNSVCSASSRRIFSLSPMSWRFVVSAVVN